MSEARIVNALVESLANAPGPHREPVEVQRRLAHCQQVCQDWFRECDRYALRDWIDLMITPGRECPFRPK